MLRKTTALICISAFILVQGCQGQKSADAVHQSNDASVVRMATSAKAVEPENITTPVLIRGFFMGGLYKGRWLRYDEFINRGIVGLNGFTYDVYSGGRKTCSVKGGYPTDCRTGETLKGNKYEEGYDCLDLYDSGNKAIDYDIAIKADWSLFPRKYTSQNTKQKTYYDLVSGILKNEGVRKPDFKIKQIIRTDLDGDGTEEVLIAANNAADGKLESVKKGDNAVIIMRKIVNGKVENQVVDKYITLKAPEYDSPYRILFRCETIADLDGDGIMEVVVKNWYYEGEEYCIWKLRGNKLELVTGNGWGA